MPYDQPPEGSLVSLEVLKVGLQIYATHKLNADDSLRIFQ